MLPLGFCLPGGQENKRDGNRILHLMNSQQMAQLFFLGRQESETRGVWKALHTNHWTWLIWREIIAKVLWFFFVLVQVLWQEDVRMSKGPSSHRECWVIQLFWVFVMCWILAVDVKEHNAGIS